MAYVVVKMVMANNNEHEIHTHTKLQQKIRQNKTTTNKRERKILE